MKKIRWYGPTMVLLLTVLGVMIAGPGIARSLAWEYRDARIRTIGESLRNSESLKDLSASFRKVSQVVEPSVVAIQVFSTKPVHSRPGVDEDMLRRFFGPRMMPPDLTPDPGDPDAAPQNKGMDKYNVPQAVGAGSGWVYDSAGHIITNNHVIENADKITVRFNDGTEAQATVQGADPKTDVAVLNVKVKELHPATLATQPVEQGDIVFAFGSPFRFEFSMSQGIVSAKGRRLGILADQQGYENFIQTDAAINPGNSGGPLTNIYGQVIGMNSAIATRTGVFNGLGFAIPIDMVKRVADELISKGKVSRGYLGVFIRDLDDKMAKSFGYTGKGVLVEQPIDGSPGEKAGMKRGDIIVSIDGTPVATADELRSTIAAMKPGTSVKLDIFRAGKTIQTTLNVGTLPSEVASAPGSNETTTTPADQNRAVLNKLGIDQVREMSRKIAEQFRIKYVPGVLVTSVRPDSAAATQMVRPGAVITDVMGVAVKSVEELAGELGKYDLKKGIRLSVTEAGQERFVFLELPSE